MPWLFLAFCSSIFVLETLRQVSESPMSTSDWDVTESINNFGNLICLQYIVFLTEIIVYLSIYFHHQHD